jgi:hypothetical protein
LRNPKERVPASLEKALELLEEARKRNSNLFSAGAEERILDEVAALLPVSIPSAWREVLKVSNGFLIDAFEIVPAESLPADQIPLFLPQVAGASTRYLKITDGYSGDFHCLDLSTLNHAGDCQVNEFDHEGPNEPVSFGQVSPSSSKRLFLWRQPCEIKFRFHLYPRSAGLAGVALDGGTQFHEVFHVFQSLLKASHFRGEIPASVFRG